jgi:hypothetical protein
MIFITWFDKSEMSLRTNLPKSIRINLPDNFKTKFKEIITEHGKYHRGIYIGPDRNNKNQAVITVAKYSYDEPDFNEDDARLFFSDYGLTFEFIREWLEEKETVVRGYTISKIDDSFDTKVAFAL